MKYILLILTILFFSCEKEEYCWQCKAIIYDKVYTDTICYSNVNDEIDYENRMKQLYGNGITELNCELIKH